MIAEAQKMMKDPKFQAKMKQVSQQKAFKDSMEKCVCYRNFILLILLVVVAY